MVGKLVIRGTRLTVEHVLNLLAHGASMAEVLDEVPGLTREDLLGRVDGGEAMPYGIVRIAIHG